MRRPFETVQEFDLLEDIFDTTLGWIDLMLDAYSSVGG
jgi:hypothetical protein